MEKNYLVDAIEELRKKSFKLPSFTRDERSKYVVEINDAIQALEELEVSILNYIKEQEDNQTLY